MIRTRRSTAAGLLAGGLALMTVAGIAGLSGCTTEVQQPKPKVQFPDIPDKAVADFMANTIDERTLVLPTEPHNVSGYGLVGQLRGTGDCTASNIVRQYMTKEMVRRGFGDSLMPGYEHFDAMDVLRDPHHRYAIVRVDAFIPPGARKDDFIDAQVTCLSGNKTSSLVHGSLFETDLKDGGADIENPSGAVNTRVVVKGPILVNPAYSLDNPLNASAEAKSSLRVGAILFNAKVKQDRPILLQLRHPQGGTARHIQDVIAYRFQDNDVARAINEAIIELYVPKAYKGDWQHFVAIVSHLYMRNDAEFNVAQSHKLAKLAALPGANLEDIGYCLEGIGSPALEAIRPLIADADPRVSYYMARSAAFIGDETQAAQMRLMQIAQTKGHPYRLAAVRTLGQLPPSASLSAILGQLLDSDMTLIRIAAYQILCRPRDGFGGADVRIHRTFVAPANDPRNQKFVLDIVPSAGRNSAPPLIYVSRSGMPRIAIIGNMPLLSTGSPIAMADNRLTFASDGRDRNLVIFYRDPTLDSPVQVLSQPEADLLVARLGGMGNDGLNAFNFNYGEILAILQKLSQGNRLITRDSKGREIAAAFVMQEPGRLEQDLANAPLIDLGEAPAFGPAMPPQGPSASRNPNPTPQPQQLPATLPPGAPVNGSNAPSFGPGMPPTTPATPTSTGVGSNAPKF